MWLLILVCVSVNITSSAVGTETCAITAGKKKYKSIVKKKKKKHDKIEFIRKNKLNIIEVLIHKVLIDSYISHKKYVSVNNVLRKYNEVKEEIQLLKFLCIILYKCNWY